ncbi:MAG: bifunctional phosphopantothenoylcysteine decarboxylase/phosphopantothenate--cysteine ligase CoaBC [Candidatus Edwardsbacteria bacterium]|jgi:phosphopantothenoylcysteine decarboxylase/phosphopantothenate--cysteine ligase|nr:bifunctional phosphopantothenoylcysteine decarboxylase/phosphopantothenate--cysteine ligase CoaBC [Candidatus Edwardsbacteria bacterium]
MSSSPSRPTVVLGVTGSIAAYKALDLVSRLRRKDIAVIAVMTRSARELVGPASFESLSGNPVAVDLFPRSKPQQIEHIALADAADALAIVPATANIIGKAACGIADDLLSTVIMAATAPVVCAPAMNVNMWNSAAVQLNVKILAARGWTMVGPAEGRLACGTDGRGRLAPVEEIEAAILKALGWSDDLAGVPVLVTAGRTEEPVDPVRFLSNRSSGRMGYALARAAALRGAKVTLVTGPADVPAPAVGTTVRVRTAEQMLAAVTQHLPHHRALIMAAAVADYRPKNAAARKIKKSGTATALELAENPDILKYASVHKKAGTVLVGFALETDDLVANATKKMKAKGLDLVVANGASALGSDDNDAILIRKGGKPLRCGRQSKRDLARTVLDEVVKLVARPR